jgi:hypothetical protein
MHTHQCMFSISVSLHSHNTASKNKILAQANTFANNIYAIYKIILFYICLSMSGERTWSACPATEEESRKSIKYLGCRIRTYIMHTEQKVHKPDKTYCPLSLLGPTSRQWSTKALCQAKCLVDHLQFRAGKPKANCLNFTKSFGKSAQSCGTQGTSPACT